jgi:uncharacterized protein YqeY
MSLHQTIKSGIKEAMLAKDEVRLMVLRGLSSAFTNELVAKGRKPQEELTDEEALAVITRSAKQRKDSIEQFRNAGREDLATSEEAELAVVNAFLPAQMSREEVDAVVAAKKAELGVTDKADSGKLMSALMKDLKGKADGSVVKAAVEASFV